MKEREPSQKRSFTRATTFIHEWITEVLLLQTDIMQKKSFKQILTGKENIKSSAQVKAKKE